MTKVHEHDVLEPLHCSGCMTRLRIGEKFYRLAVETKWEFGNEEHRSEWSFYKRYCRLCAITETVGATDQELR